MKKIFNTLLVVAMLLVQIIPTTLVRADDTKPAITINKAIVDESYIIEVIDMIKKSNNGKNYNVYAVVAPSIAGQFSYVKLGQVITAIKELGFNYVNEVALGADMVATTEAKEFATKYYEKTKTRPDENVLREYGMLFLPREDLPDWFELLMLQTGHFDICYEYYKNNTPRYNGFDEFLDACGLPK